MPDTVVGFGVTSFRALLQWRGDIDYAVVSLVCKQGLLYQLVAAAVGFATKRIKDQIHVGKSKFLLEIAGDPSRPPGALLR